MGRIVIDPITRIEGHLKVEVMVDNGEVKEAKSSGTLFRGFEIILKGRDPRDANRITQRICGVCPTSHSTASTLCLDSAFGLGGSIPDNGRLIRNLILGAAHIADHILHFYHLTALDYVDVTKVAKYESNDATLISVRDFIGQQLVAHYIEALRMRRKAQEMCSIFGGKMPHNMSIVPGGVTEVPTVDKITSFLWRLNELRTFIDDIYLRDVLAVAEVYSDYLEIGAGCRNLLSYGGYELDGKEADLTKRKRLFKQGTVGADLKLGTIDSSAVTEDVKHSWYDDSTSGRKPTEGETIPKEGKDGAYSWIKSPRYNGQVYEVGPLARIMTTYVAGDQKVKALIDPALAKFKAGPEVMFSVLGRHLARALGAKIVADMMPSWLLELKPGEPVYQEYEIPEESTGMGLVEAARGALGHWIEIKDKRIANYQCVVPSTWNMSPRDDKGQPGPLEQALTGTQVRDEENPFEIVRIVRSFDPCLACAIHLITPKGKTLSEFRVV